MGEVEKKEDGEEENGCAKCHGWKAEEVAVAQRAGAAASARPRDIGLDRKEFMVYLCCLTVVTVTSRLAEVL